MGYQYQNRYSEKDWKGRLKELLEAFLYKSFTKKHKYKVSHATYQKRRDVMFLSFEQMREGGFKINDPTNIKSKHIEYLIARWVSEKLSPSTITNRISILRLFTESLGKRGMVASPEDYVADKSLVKRTYVAKTDKSWSAVNIDSNDIAEKASNFDIYSGMQVRLMLTFGLRLKEALSLKPFKSDYGAHLLIMDGTKGGRTRIVPIDDSAKRQLVDECRNLVKHIDRNMCDPSRTLIQEKARIYYVMRILGITQKQLGVTPHGLRHEYLNNRYEEISGQPSPVRGGIIVDKEKDTEARLITMLEAGHGRTKVGAAYYGSSKMPASPKPKPPEEQDS